MFASGGRYKYLFFNEPFVTSVLRCFGEVRNNSFAHVALLYFVLRVLGLLKYPTNYFTKLYSIAELHVFEKFNVLQPTSYDVSIIDTFRNIIFDNIQ